MPLPISAVGQTAPITAPEHVRTEQGRPGEFMNVLRSAMNGVEGARTAASASIDRLLAGEGEDLHNTALAVQRAELSFEMFVQVRNKVVQAYQEVMRMQI
jgi:flagellar hook-basal body complex protein FliE